MKILMLSSGDRVPSARFRLHPFAQPLRELGHSVVVLQSVPQKYEHFEWLGFRPSQKLKRLIRYWHALRAKLGGYDVVLLDREVFDAPDLIAEHRFRRACPRMVLDVDDAVFLRHPGKFEKLAALADAVVVGNRFLRAYTEPHNSAIVEIPTCVPLSDYPAAIRPADGSRPVIGWMGTSANLRYLDVVADPLRTLAESHEFELLLIAPDLEHFSANKFEGVEVRHEVWDGPREVQQLHQMDIGIMPLFAEQQWDKYKCGLKLIQYMAVGLPGVASPVGVNAEIVSGECGFVASDANQWVTVLDRLLGDAALRRDVGKRARERVAEKYSVEANVAKLERVLAGAGGHT